MLVEILHGSRVDVSQPSSELPACSSSPVAGHLAAWANADSP